MFLEVLQEDYKQARLARTDKVKTSLLMLIVSEVANIGKNDGGRITSDKETLKKLTKIRDDLQTVYGLQPTETGKHELSIVNAYVDVWTPKQLTETELILFMKDVPDNDKIGNVMKALNAAHAGQFDGKLAKEVWTALHVQEEEVK